MKESTLDLIAAARVSRRVELDGIRLTEVIFTLENEGSGELTLAASEPVVAKPKPPENERIQVHCSYMFSTSGTSLTQTAGTTHGRLRERW